MGIAPLPWHDVRVVPAFLAAARDTDRPLQAIAGRLYHNRFAWQIIVVPSSTTGTAEGIPGIGARKRRRPYPGKHARRENWGQGEPFRAIVCSGRPIAHVACMVMSVPDGRTQPTMKGGGTV